MAEDEEHQCAGCLRRCHTLAIQTLSHNGEWFFGCDRLCKVGRVQHCPAKCEGHLAKLAEKNTKKSFKKILHGKFDDSSG